MDEARARELLRGERERTEEMIERLRADTGARERDAAGELTDVDQHQADSGTETYDRSAGLGRLADLERHLDAVRRAERRLEEGSYGLSVESGRPIPDARLEAVPWAERTAEEDAAHPSAGHPGVDVPGETATPLDEPEPDPPDLDRIPMSRGDPGPDVDPQEGDDHVDLGAGGRAYEGEGGSPRVGDPDQDEPRIDRRYRPD